MNTMNEFKTMVAEEIKNYLGAEYADAEVKIKEICKTNQKLNGLIVNRDGHSLSPTVYLESFFERYKETNSFEDTMSKIAEVITQSEVNVSIDVDKILKKDKIVCVLINQEANEDLLKDIPHRSFHDLTIIYKCIVDIEEISSEINSEFASVTIQNKHLAFLDMTEEELYEVAMSNTPHLLPFQVENIMGMKVATNEKKTQGANFMLFNEELKKFAEEIDDDFFVLPSSIHELILVPADLVGEDGRSIQDLLDMVFYINSTEVKTAERLSNQVYYYDRKLDEIQVKGATAKTLADCA